jgi:hypothetical protein
VAGGHAADDLLGAGLLRISVDFVLDRLIKLECCELGIDRRAVKKEIGPASSGLDKAETFVGIERAYFSILHLFSLVVRCEAGNDEWNSW